MVRFAPRHGQAAQGAEHEHEGAEELVDEVVDAVVVGVGGAEGAEDGVGVFGVLIVRVVVDVHHELTCGGTKQLGDDVRQHEAPVEQAIHSLGDGHGRVDVRAGDGTEHEHRDHHAEAVAHGDVQPARMVALGVLQFNVRDSAVAEDHQNGGTEEFGRKFDKSRVFHCCFLYCFFSVRIRLMSIPLSADNSVQHYSPHWKSSTKRLDRPSACRTVIQKSENKKALEPKLQGFICAPSGIRTLDTLIKSQLL